MHNRRTARRECRSNWIRGNLDDVQPRYVSATPHQVIAAADDETLRPAAPSQLAYQHFGLAFTTAIIGGERDVTQAICHHAMLPHTGVPLPATLPPADILID
jgi:hypothetical protein